MFSREKKDKNIKDEGQDDDSLYGRVKKRLGDLSHEVLMLNHELLENQLLTPLTFNLLTLIESLQMNFFVFHPLMDEDIWDSNYLDTYRSIIQYFQIDSVLQNGTQASFLVILYLFFAYVVIVLIAIFYVIERIKEQPRRNSAMLSYTIKFLSIQASLIITIVPLPLFHSSFSTFVCSTDSPFTSKVSCYQGLFYLHFVVAILGFVGFVLICLLFTYLYIDLNPTSQIPFAEPQSMLRLVKLALKIILPFYVVIDYNGQFILQIIVVINLAFLGILFFRFLASPMYHSSVENFSIFCETSLFWMSTCITITTFLDSNSRSRMGILYLVICLPLMWFSFKAILHLKAVGYKSMAVKEFDDDTDVEMYVLMLMKHIENREDANTRIELEGILRYHSKSCTNSECHCHSLVTDETHEDDVQTISTNWYRFVLSILEEAIELKFEKSTKLHLLHSYILHEKMHNNFKALFELMIAHERKSEFSEEFAIFRFASQIEAEIKENDEKTNDTRNVDVNKIVLFQKKYVEFQESIEKSVLLHLDFWRELLEEKPEIQKIENTGSKITLSVESVHDQFLELREIYGNHIKCLEIYGFYLKEVVNDSQESERVLENMKYARNSQNVNKQFVDSDRMKYGENSNTAIVQVSGNYGEIGVLTNMNRELTRILGWSKPDVIEQNISKIMPKVYADNHDKLMERFLKTSESKVIGLERIVICVNKSQFIVPCSLMIKVLPNLEEGITIAGFLKEIDPIFTTNAVTAAAATPGTKTTIAGDTEEDEIEHYMVFSVENDVYIMQGISQSCYTSFGIPVSLMHGNNQNNLEFTVDQFCPDLLTLESLDELKSPGGLVLGFDTTNIKKHFQIDEGEGEGSDDEDGGEYSEVNNTQGQATPKNQGDNQHDGIGAAAAAAAEGQKDQNGDDDEDDDDDDDQDNSNNRRKKQSKYKSTNVRMQLVLEQSFDEKKVYVVKFTEVDEFDNEAKMKFSPDHNDMNGIEIMGKTTTAGGGGKKQLKHNEEDDDEEINSDREHGNDDSVDRESNVSNQSMNDEVRKLKDFKSLISEKTVPTSISILQKTVLVMIVILLTLSSVELGLKLSQDSSITTGTASIFTAFRRPSIMADVSFYARRISNIANSIRSPDTGQTQATALAADQNSIATNVNLMQTNQFANMNNLIRMDTSTYNKLSSIYYTVSYQQQTRGDIKTEQDLLTDAMIQLITSSSSLANSTMSSFVDSGSTTYVDSTIKNLYYVLTNGLFVLRKGTENEATTMYSFYYDKLSTYETNIRVIMIVAIVVLVLSLAVLIPYVFSVHKTNHRVLSLFGMIRLDEIKILADKCEAYTTNFLEDKKFSGETGNQQENEVEDPVNEEPEDKEGGVKKEDSNIEIDGEAENEFDSLQNQNGKSPKEAGRPSKFGVASHLKTDMEMVPNEDGGENHNNNNNKKQQQQHKKQQKVDQFDKDKKKKVKRSESGQEEETRLQKLMNSKDNNRGRVVFQFSTFVLFFMSYFIIGFVLQLNFIDNMRTIMRHLYQVSQRSSIIKYCLVYMAEEITTDTKQLESGVNNLWKFIDLSYQLENAIASSSLDGYPSNLSSYFSEFTTANYGNFCSIFPETSTLTKTACAEVNSGMLEKGLKISITSYVEDIRKMITAYEALTTTSTAIKAALFASDEYIALEQMQFYMTPMIEKMNADLLSGTSSYVDSFGKVEAIKFGLYIGVIFIVFILIWLPYLFYLRQKIWRTKGMLNMIPMSIIRKDPALKQEFASGDILSAVK